MTSSNSLEKLSHISVLKITGEDASTFLQGQLTNDINNLQNTWQFSGYCSPKGRLIALLQMWRVDGDDTIYALIDKSVTESTLKRLRMYVMRSKVVIDVLENTHCYGEWSSDINGTRFSVEKNQENHVLSYASRRLIVDFDNELDTPKATLENRWLESDIQDCLPNINSDTSELFVPQMVNLDLLDGINFKKGCYTGQEIVARMHYLGKLKQRMFVCTTGSSEPIQAATKILCNDKNAGNVVSSVGSSMTAVLRTEYIDEEMQFYTENGEKIAVEAKQPYEISSSVA